MANTRRAYTDEYKREVVAKLGEGRGAITALAKAEGLDPSLIHGWRKKFGADAITPKGASQLAASELGPLTGGGSGDQDPLLELAWQHAASLPSMRERFVFLANAGQRLL